MGLFIAGFIVGCIVAGRVGYALAFRWLGAAEKTGRMNAVRAHRSGRFLP